MEGGVRVNPRRVVEMGSLGALLLAADFAYSLALSFPATVEWADTHRMVTVLSVAWVLWHTPEMATAKR